MADKIIKGMFISVDVDELIETSATLNERTGELSVCDLDGNIQYVDFEEQYFESNDGKFNYRVCPICHNYVMKFKVIFDCRQLVDNNEICMNGCND